MSPWIGNGLFLAMVVASVAIRAPHDRRRQRNTIVVGRKDVREVLLLVGMAAGMILLPVLSFTPVLEFARYRLYLVPLAAGVAFAAAGLWLFHRSHAELGPNWSPTLEIREGHRLVTGGVYRSIRHPMYTSLFLMGLAQACLISNWIAGPALLAAFAAMFASRLHTEERMMRATFGAEYDRYRARTKRIVPRVW
jgi:protein-S-isoprenylcysteine O-methyltransferase Ste14